MNYSVVVWGFDNENDYYRDCDIIKGKSFSEVLPMLVITDGQGWTLTRIEIELLEENQYIIKYHDSCTNENDIFGCKADIELEAKLKFRMSGDFAYTERYTIISVKGVKKNAKNEI